MRGVTDVNHEHVYCPHNSPVDIRDLCVPAVGVAYRGMAVSEPAIQTAPLPGFFERKNTRRVESVRLAAPRVRLHSEL